MSNGWFVRAEQPPDANQVAAVHRAAFGRDGEAILVDALRRGGIAIASLVAMEHDQVAGHILFSRVWIEAPGRTETVASLAPMAVRPDLQGRGIGSALVREGISACRSSGFPAVVVVGHPSYYSRFGFSHARVAHLASPYAGAAFMGLDLVDGFLAAVRGRVRYPDAFASL